MAVGEACERWPCRFGSYCDQQGNGDSTCTICLPAPGVGENCQASHGACQSGLDCDIQTDLCTARGEAGSPCEDDGNCVTRWCVRTTHTCAQPLARDQPCTATDRCAGFLLCQSGTCQALRLSGESCVGGDPGGSNCVAGAACVNGFCERAPLCGHTIPQGGFCANDAGCVNASYCDSATSTCVPRFPIGAVCDRTAQCQEPLLCLDLDPGNQCSPWVAEGAWCRDQGQCDAGLWCDWETSVCVALLANGVECISGYQCFSGHCGGDGVSGVCAQPAQSLVCAMP